MGLTDEQQKVAEAIRDLSIDNLVKKYHFIEDIAKILCNPGDHANLFIRTAIGE